MWSGVAVVLKLILLERITFASSDAAKDDRKTVSTIIVKGIRDIEILMTGNARLAFIPSTSFAPFRQRKYSMRTYFYPEEDCNK